MTASLLLDAHCNHATNIDPSFTIPTVIPRSHELNNTQQWSMSTPGPNNIKPARLRIPGTCPYCGKSFTRAGGDKYYLKRHLKSCKVYNAMPGVREQASDQKSGSSKKTRKAGTSSSAGGSRKKSSKRRPKPWEEHMLTFRLSAHDRVTIATTNSQETDIATASPATNSIAEFSGGTSSTPSNNASDQSWSSPSNLSISSSPTSFYGSTQSPSDSAASADLSTSDLRYDQDASSWSRYLAEWIWDVESASSGTCAGTSDGGLPGQQ